MTISASVSCPPSAAHAVEDVLGWEGCGWEARPATRQEWSKEIQDYRRSGQVRMGGLGLFFVVLIFDGWLYASHQVKDGFWTGVGLDLLLMLRILGDWLDQRGRCRLLKRASPTFAQMEAWRCHWASKDYLDAIGETDVPFLAGDEQRLNALSPSSVSFKGKPAASLESKESHPSAPVRSMVSLVGNRVDPLGWKTQGWPSRPATKKEWKDERSRLRMLFSFNLFGVVLPISWLSFTGWLLLTHQPMERGLWAAVGAQMLYLLVISVMSMKRHHQKDWVYQPVPRIGDLKIMESKDAQAYQAAIALTDVPFLAGDRARLLSIAKQLQEAS